MTGQTVVEHAPSVNDTDMVHLVCDCRPHIGLCGTRLKGIKHPDSTEIGCVVCKEFEGGYCPHCGVSFDG